MRTAVLMLPAVRRTHIDAHEGQLAAVLPSLWQEKCAIGATNQLFSWSVVALGDAYCLGLPSWQGFR